MFDPVPMPVPPVPKRDPWAWWGPLVVGGLLLARTRPAGVDTETALRGREVAAKLKAAGALDEAADLYERYLDAAEEEPSARARIAYSLGNTYLESGQFNLPV